MDASIENMIQNQKYNTTRAYEKSGYDYSSKVLADIVVKGLAAKQTIIDKLGAPIVILSRPLTDNELVGRSYTLKDLKFTHSEYAFSFVSKTCTERSTGKCKPISKFLNDKGVSDSYIDNVLACCSVTRNTFIAAHPWFLIGSSVAARGQNVENSCHHPASSTNDYKSGPISYALDNHTIIFGVWNEQEQGMSGRQLVYVDPASGIVTGRKYGDISEGDSSPLRKELYKLLMPETPVSSWKKTNNYDIDKDDYSGYLDDGYFNGYRPNKENAIEICLTTALCPSCGYSNSQGYLLCDDCYRGGESCDACGCELNEDDTYYSPNGYPLCESCFDERYFRCDRCGEVYDRGAVCHSEDSDNDYCQSCAERKGLMQCDNCSAWYGSLNTMADGDYLCEHCTPSDAAPCTECGSYERERYMTKTIEGDVLCSDCDSKAEECTHCNNYTTQGLTETVDGNFVCDDCIDNHYPEVCPGCGLAQATEGVCSDECAVNNLFKMAA